MHIDRQISLVLGTVACVGTRKEITRLFGGKVEIGRGGKVLGRHSNHVPPVVSIGTTNMQVLYYSEGSFGRNNEPTQACVLCLLIKNCDTPSDEI
jgi:hypothetical protein